MCVWANGFFSLCLIYKIELYLMFVKCYRFFCRWSCVGVWSLISFFLQWLKKIIMQLHVLKFNLIFNQGIFSVTKYVNTWKKRLIWHFVAVNTWFELREFERIKKEMEIILRLAIGTMTHSIVGSDFHRSGSPFKYAIFCSITRFKAIYTHFMNSFIQNAMLCKHL